MATFNSASGAPSHEDQARLLSDLATAALARWNGRFHDLSLLKYRENAVFSVRRDDGARAVLRIHRLGYHSDAQLHSELYWMRELGRSGIEVPPIIPASDGSLFVHANAPGSGETRQVDMLGWLDGSAVGEADAALHYRLGQFAARLHKLGSEIVLPDDFTRHRWDEAGLLGREPVWGRFWELPELTTDQRALLLAATHKATADLATYGKSAERFGMIHADLIRDNVLDHRGQLQAIDFDDCGFGWYMFELATVLHALPEEADYERTRDQLFAGYRTVRALPDADIERLPLFLFLRATTYLGWLQTRAETQTARERASWHIERCCRAANDYLELQTGLKRSGERR